MVCRGDDRRRRCGSSRVGFVGAGRMGLPMVERLAAAGHDLVVYARRPETPAALDRLGVRPTTELTRGRRRGRRAAAVRLQRRAAGRGRRAAGRRPAGRRRARLARDRPGVRRLRSLADRFPGIEVVDAPVSGGRGRTSRPDWLTVLLGGPPAARARRRRRRPRRTPTRSSRPANSAPRWRSSWSTTSCSPPTRSWLAEAVWLGEAARGGSRGDCSARSTR